MVVVNASRDGTGEIAASGDVRVVHEAAPNRSRARNAGIAAARVDLITFTDADCVARPGWLAARPGWLAALLACRGAAPLVAGPMEIDARSQPNAIERFEAFGRFDQATWMRELGWAATANLMVEREAFNAIAWFDSTYPHIGEDVDFCVRAGRAGFALGFCAPAIVSPGAEHQLGAVIRRAFCNGYSAAQVERRLGVGHVAWRIRAHWSRRGRRSRGTAYLQQTCRGGSAQRSPLSRQPPTPAA